MMKSRFVSMAALVLMTACMPIPSIDEDNTATGDNNVTAVYPIARYLFDGSADDSSENGFHGVLIGNPEFISDTPNGSSGALRLNAFKEQFVNIPYPMFNGLDQYSFSIWIKDFSQGVVFSSEGGNGLPRLVVNDSQKLELYDWLMSGIYPTSFVFEYDSTAIMSSEWHHIAVTFYKGEVALYVDGIKRDSSKSNYTISDDVKVFIGGNAGGSYVNYMNMKIDNVMFFDYSLTDDEVKYIHQNRL